MPKAKNTLIEKKQKQKKSKSKNMYVDNEKLFNVLVQYKKDKRKAIKEKTEMPKIPEYLGYAVLQIATHYSYLPEFINYSYRDEMIADGIENVLMYFENFDPKKSKNPFSYFTQIIYYAFLRRIAKENKQQYVKYKSIKNAPIVLEGFDVTDEDDINVVKQEPYDNINDFIYRFEKSLADKKEKKKEQTKIKTEKGLEKMMA